MLSQGVNTEPNNVTLPWNSKPETTVKVSHGHRINHCAQSVIDSSIQLLATGEYRASVLRTRTYLSSPPARVRAEHSILGFHWLLEASDIIAARSIQIVATESR